MPACQVVEFATVGFHVIQLPRLVTAVDGDAGLNTLGTLGHDFPFAFPHGPGAADDPVELAVLCSSIFVLKERCQSSTLRREHVSTLMTGRNFDACKFRKRGQKVDQVADVVDDTTTFHSGRPACNQGCGDAAFVVEVLEQPEGRVAGVRPGRTDRLVRVDCPRRQVRRVVDLFRTSSIIGQEQHQCVFLLTQVANFVEYATDGLIKPIHHGRVDRHRFDGVFTKIRVGSVRALVGRG